MTSLSGGNSETAELRRRVMVVDEDRERCQRLCTLLTSHGLTTQAVRATELAMTVQGWSGVILVGSSRTGTTGWELAERIRTFDAHVPIILLGHVSAEPIGDAPAIQAYLPREPSPDLLLMEVRRWLKPAEPAAASRKLGPILLVDDEPKVLAILRHFLETKGFLVTTAGSGEDALAALRQAAPKVVLLDVKMPGMDGMLILQHIRAIQPMLPVIFLTQLDEDTLMEEAAARGAQGCLIKPFNFQHLEALLLTHLL